LLQAPASAISKFHPMPTYEYQCEKCNQTFEAFQSMKDEAFATCPKKFCRLEVWGEGKVKRLIGTGAGLIFKGSGFYITDYRSSNYKESAKKEGGSSSTGEGSKGSSDKPKESGSSKTEGAKGDAGKSSSGSDKGSGSSSSTPSTST
jgi:putative FmdB family regulatory protein